MRGSLIGRSLTNHSCMFNSGMVGCLFLDYLFQRLATHKAGKNQLGMVNSKMTGITTCPPPEEKDQLKYDGYKVNLRQTKFIILIFLFNEIFLS